MIRIEVTLNADPTAISPVVEGIMEMARRLDCAAGKEFEIETAIREALANAIVHGCKNDPAQKVQCCVACDDERGMLIIVRDPGPGFDPFRVPDPLNGENVYSNHGRGIFLINQLMDEVKFERNGTEIHMRKYLEAAIRYSPFALGLRIVEFIAGAPFRLPLAGWGL